MPQTIRLGTRESPLALAQAHHVSQKIEAFGYKTTIVPFITSGDRFQTGPLRDIGGKELFTKEIEKALLAQKIDVAIHACKDLASEPPADLTLSAILKREDPRDAWIGPPLSSLGKATELIVGTSSLRRQVQLKRLYPRIRIREIRGNVQTRLKKYQAGEVDALILAYAGLKRLDLTSYIEHTFDVEEMIPAVGQGSIVLQCHRSDHKIQQILTPLNHPQSAHCITLERGFLKALNGSCHMPIGGYAFCDTQHLHFNGLLATPDGHVFETLQEKIPYTPHLNFKEHGHVLGHTLRNSYEKALQGPGA